MGKAAGDKSLDKKASKRKSAIAAIDSVTQDEGGATSLGVIEADASVPAHAIAVRQTLLSPIAKPLADAKLRKRAFRLVKKAVQGKQLKRGVKEVVKALRKKATGVCIIAGDISPIDVIAHLPIMCEDRDIPYLFVPSKEDLGLAAQTKRPTSCLLVQREPFKGQAGDELKDFQESYDEVHKRIKAVQIMY